ncbi:MAG: ABC transporter permease [Pseudomonadales bacterium]|nr:ABC transporter permease [Pseudomonadales bacterium]MCP5329979.1 ABC transporter permease [Pseudomonadales bacterium]MCP5343113.1 ABC transporter permease [Pseudomonadales bacterium]
MIRPLTMEPGSSCVSMHGDWTLAGYDTLLASARSPDGAPASLDASALTALDTAGAALLVKLLGAEQLCALIPSATGLSEERRALLLAVARVMRDRQRGQDKPRWHPGDGLARLGQATHSACQQVSQLLGFMGLALQSFAILLLRPRGWRITALVAQMHQAGLNAVPIVVLLNFLIGAVVAFLGATVLESFGATIYTVDLVAYAFMRELGVLLVAILLAGRTASAFTAQIGSMKVNEELDALRVQGLSPMELLVLPRMMALIIMLPLLTFIGVMAGMLGGAAVAVLSLDISPNRFLGIVQEIPLRHLLLGLSKAPVFAILIALIGCLEGFKVKGSAQSVGEHTTSSVVQSIFVVILVDAVAALFFMEMGW